MGTAIDVHGGEGGGFTEVAVGALVVVIVQVGSEAGLGFALGSVAFEIDFVVFDGAPESLNEDVVQEAASAVHGDFDPGGKERMGEFFGGELAPLVCVEDFLGAVAGDGL